MDRVKPRFSKTITSHVVDRQKRLENATCGRGFFRKRQKNNPLFLTALRSQGFQTPSFWNKKIVIDHKRPIKAIKSFALSLLGRGVSFRDLFYAAVFVYRSDGLGDRAFDHHSRNGDGAFSNKKSSLICPGGEVTRGAGIDSHITFF